MNCDLKFLYYALKKKSNYVNFHKHDCFELVYYMNGSGRTVTGEKEYFYTPNTFMVIQPNCLHDESHDESTHILFIGFTFADGAIALDNGLYRDDHQHTILNLLKCMKKEIAEQKKYFDLKLSSLLREVLIEVLRMDDSIYKRNSDFSHILRFMKENFSQHIDLSVLAELSGYSYHHFRHLFKQKTGLSPVNYLIDQRIENAKVLLEQTSLSMTEISQECGFSNESQFSSMFKKATARTPRMYRKEAGSLDKQKQQNANES